MWTTCACVSCQLGAYCHCACAVRLTAYVPLHVCSYLGADSQIPGGQQRKDYWKKGAVVPDVSMSAGKLQFSAFGTKELWIALITFLYLDFLDATSTMFAMARLVAAKVGARPRLCSRAMVALILLCFLMRSRSPKRSLGKEQSRL